MKIKEKMPIDSLYFGVTMFPLSYDNKSVEPKVYNLFDFARVKHSVATYVITSEEERAERIRDPLMWCFGDTWSRSEFEFVICPWWAVGSVGRKIDVYTMFVKPNAELLMDLVDRVTVSSAKAYLAEWRKAHRR